MNWLLAAGWLRLSWKVSSTTDSAATAAISRPLRPASSRLAMATAMIIRLARPLGMPPAA